jgi:hypothetical protein
MIRRRLRGAALLMVLAIVAGGTRFILPAGAQAEPVIVSLHERNDSGVAGEAELTATDGATWVRIFVEGGDESLIAYLHRGDCTAFNDRPAIPLALTTPGTQSATAVDVPLDDLLAGEYLIDLHAAGGDFASLLDPATSVACGEIGDRGETPGAVATTAPPVTGIGPIHDGRDWMVVIASILAMLSLGLAFTCLRSTPQPVAAPVVINVVALHRLRSLSK